MSRHPLLAYPRQWLTGPIVLGLVLAYATAGWGKIVRYVDANGVIWLANVPTPSGALESKQTTAGFTREPAARDRARQVRTHPYRSEVERLARRHALNPQLVSALIAVESAFNPEALSPKGAQGLMQLMPLIARYYRVSNPWDPQQNIEAGVRYLSDLLQLFDDRLPLALAAYNGGEGLVRKHGGVPPFLQSYVNRVLTAYEQARGTSIYRYIMPSGAILFSNVPLSQEQLVRWEASK